MGGGTSKFIRDKLQLPKLICESAQKGIWHRTTKNALFRDAPVEILRYVD